MGDVESAMGREVSGAELRDPLPAFLACLDADPDRAKREFYVFARRFFDVCPPREYRRLPEGARADIVDEVYLACIDDDFRRLRTYRDLGRPFAAWFSRLAAHRIADWVERERRQPRVLEFPAPVGAMDDGLSRLPDPRGDPARVAGDREALHVVRRCLARLGALCRFLVVAAAEGRTPRELALLLAWPPSRGKEVSDKLRHCRRILARHARDEGVDIPAHLAG